MRKIKAVLEIGTVKDRGIEQPETIKIKSHWNASNLVWVEAGDMKVLVRSVDLEEAARAVRQSGRV